MAKLQPETTEIINQLKQKALEIVDAATALELKIFELFGESEQTLSYMDDLIKGLSIYKLFLHLMSMILFFFSH